MTTAQAALPLPASRLSYEAITEYAEIVGEHYAIYDADGCADLHEFVERLGGAVEVAHDDESIHVRAVGDFTIFIPRMTTARRDRFTIAHELGHYFVHYVYPGETGVRSHQRGASNLLETQANVFAASLLMPAEQFRLAWDELEGNPWKVARRFDVSPAAARVRAAVLGLNRA